MGKIVVLTLLQELLNADLHDVRSSGPWDFVTPVRIYIFNPNHSNKFKQIMSLTLARDGAGEMIPVGLFYDDAFAICVFIAHPNPPVLIC